MKTRTNSESTYSENAIIEAFHHILIKDQCVQNELTSLQQFFENFESIIDWYLETNTSMSMIHKLLFDLLRHNNSDLRLFAAKALLIEISYLMQVEDDEPLNNFQEIFFPLLLEKLNDPCLEIRKWIACSLCYLSIGEQVEPQLLVGYVESMLEIESPAFISVAIFGLYNLLFHHQCFLTDTAILRISNLCLKKDCFDTDTRNDSLALFNLQVQHTDLPLDIEIIEKCIHFVDEEDSNSEKIRTAKKLLALINSNFLKQSNVLTLPTTIINGVLNYFEVPEVRKWAWDPYASLISASEGVLSHKLMKKLLAVLRSCARTSNQETQNFVLACLGGISDNQQKKDEILAILTQSNNLEQLPADTQTLSEDNPNTSLEEKDLDTLLRELIALNSDNPIISQILRDNSLRNTLAAVKQACTKDSLFVPAGKPIQEWDVSHCQTWSEAVRQDKTKASAADFQVEVLAVIIRASVLDSAQIPRGHSIVNLIDSS